MKHFLYSKTLWLAVLVGAIGVLQGLPAELLTPQQAMIANLVLMGLLGINRTIGSTAPLTASTKSKDTFQG